VDGAKNRSSRTLRGNVDAISQLFCGFTSAVQAYENDLAEFEGRDTVEFCERALSLPPPRCFDLF
ncbi:MAG: hypothetical protein ABH878_05250, partial [bacterium]